MIPQDSRYHALQGLLTILAAGAQQEVVRARLARDVGVSENTAEAYLHTATTMRLLTTLQPWGRNLRGRVTRRPKTSLNDTGFAAALTGFTESHALSLADASTSARWSNSWSPSGSRPPAMSTRRPGVASSAFTSASQTAT